MIALQGKKILLGVCGSIAAYKAAFLVRLLVKSGAEVKVIMTPDATAFVTPLTFSTLSKNEVLTRFFDNSGGQVWNNHVELGLWADAMLIAPATATTIAKMANGLCDNLLTATYLSARCPVFVAPAMDLDMWQHPATQRNIQLLTKYGNTVIPVGSGELASGLWGNGRLAEPDEIVRYINHYFTAKQASAGPLKNKQILITAGPTFEPIDPVRFIGNRSSGKMGIALAEAALEQGALVSLVIGPTSVQATQHPNLEIVQVETAQEMFDATVTRFPDAHVAILAAAVSDYTPDAPSGKKIKKTGNTLTLQLHKTKDILAHLGSLKHNKQVLVGFALETDNELQNALDKLQKKNLNFIVLNSLNDAGAGFKHNTNKITILDKRGNTESFPLKNKPDVARDILVKVQEELQET